MKEDTLILTCKLGNEIINCYDGTHNKEQFDKRFVHVLSKTRIYQCWADMKQRCYNKNIDCYGGTR